MKTKTYLILGAVIVGLGVVGYNVFSEGTDTNLNAVTKTVTGTSATTTTTVVTPEAPVIAVPTVGDVVNDAESTTEGNTKEVNTNNTAE